MLDLSDRWIDFTESFTPPQDIREAARRALDVRATKPPSQRGGTPVGIARARDLANGRPVSLRTIRRMVAYFDRHEIDKQGATWKDKGKGWQAWQLWGGDAGRAWAKRILRNYAEMVEFNEPSEERDEMDALGDRLASEASPAIRGMLKPIMGLLRKSESVAEFRSRLETRDIAPSKKLTKLLTDGLIIAELAGRYTAEQVTEEPVELSELDPYLLPPSEAIAYFRNRLNFPVDVSQLRSDWSSHAFFISGLTDAQLLSDLRSLVERTFTEGMDYHEFDKRFRERVQNSGWEPRDGVSTRAQIVFDANLRQAFSYGQLQQYTRPEVLTTYPEWEWRHRDSRRPRPHHLAMDGVRFEASADPPLALPSGFRCRCRWIPRRDSGRARKFEYKNVRNPRTGEIEKTPATRINGELTALADPGWRPPSRRSNPEVREQMLANLPSDLANKVKAANP